MWPALWTGKMDRILCCEWLPEWARWSYRVYLACSRTLKTTCCVLQEKLLCKPYIKSLIDQACSVKMAGYWRCSFFGEFMDLDSVSVHKHAKKHLANIQPSWPHTWSITHIYCTRTVMCAVNCVVVEPSQKKCLRWYSSRQYHVLYEGKSTWMKEGHSQSCKGFGCDL